MCVACIFLSPDKDKICKQYVLALIGLWGKTYRYSWKVTKSVSEDDRVGALFKSVPSTKNGSLELFTRTETLTNITMLPIHLIALNMEHVYLKLACDAAKWRGFRIRGIQVDCVFWDENKRCIDEINIDATHPAWVDPNQLRDEDRDSNKRKHMIRHMREVSEKCLDDKFKVAMAKVSFSVKWKTPHVEAETSHWRHESDPTPKRSTDEFCNWVKEPILNREWTRVREDNALTWLFKDASPLCKMALDTVARQDRKDVTKPCGGWLDDMTNTQLLAQIAYDNNGALIQGLTPGCGKTTLIETLVQLLQNKGLKADVNYFIMSVTHVAAALADGTTIAHFRFAGRYKKDIWIIIDECSYNSAHQWGWIARFKMMGCKFFGFRRLCGSTATYYGSH